MSSRKNSGHKKPKSKRHSRSRSSPEFEVDQLLLNNHDLVQACEQGNIDLIRNSLASGNILYNISAPDDQGVYALHVAAQYARDDIVNLLLDYGSDINAIEAETKWNILHFAALGRNEVLFYTLVMHPNMNVAASPNQDRNTPLHYFCRSFSENYNNTIGAMMMIGADLNTQNFNGETPLHNACWKGHHAVVKALVALGADLNMQNDHGETPLHWAARNGSERIVRMLMNNGARSDIAGASGTPFDVAMPIESVQRLLRVGRPVLNKEALRIRVSRLTMIQKRKIEPFRWEINFHEIDIDHQAHELDHCITFIGTWRGLNVAVKVIKCDSSSVQSSVLEEYIKDIGQLSKLRNQNIVLFLGATLDPKLSYVTEYLDRGTLREVLSNNKKLPYDKKLKMTLNVANGMSYIHSRDPPIIHGNLNSYTVLVDETYNAKISDFGLSNIKEGFGSYGELVNWSAPENLSELDAVNASMKGDIWSFGMVLYEFITHKIPFDGKSPGRVYQSITQHKKPKLTSNSIKGWPEEYINCFYDCIIYDEEIRCDFDHVLEVLSSAEQ
eukprot:TRINITY_DN10888_c0_g1_i1.p1 TRINITY_DN10888_c0_g1~~TRINITY_DN10888_c0_g1_i1.p1  ORF type:complete len:556 (+),score=107.78 TRINITY_DN10888_c0_g1_i1:20-1687(+)